MLRNPADLFEDGLLARVIAHLVTSVDALSRQSTENSFSNSTTSNPFHHRVHLDPVVDPAFLLSLQIAGEVNRLCNSDPENPRGLVVLNEKQEKTFVRPSGFEEIHVVSTAAAVKYRTKDDRTLIFPVIKDQAELASLQGSFLPIFEEDFPKDSPSASFGLSEFAAQVIGVAWKANGTNRLRNEITEAATTLEYLLDFLSKFYAALEKKVEISVKAHVLWFWHVSRGISECAKAIEAAADDEDVVRLLQRVIWPAFSLPTPDQGLRYSHSPTKFADACVSYWGSRLDIADSLEIVSQVRAKRSPSELDANWLHPLSELPLESFDSLSRSFDGQSVGPLLAMALVDDSFESRLTAFGAFTEEDYFLPKAKEKSLSIDVEIVYEDDSENVSVPESVDQLLFVERTTLVEDNRTRSLVSHAIQFRIQLGEGLNEGDVKISPEFELSDRNVEFVVLEQTISGEKMTVEGTFKKRIARSRDEVKIPLKAFSLTLKIQYQIGQVNGSLQKSYIVALLPDFGAGVALVADVENLRPKDVHLLGVDTVDRDGSLRNASPYEFVSEMSRDYQVVTWQTPSERGEATLNDRPLDEVLGREGLNSLTSYAPADGDLIRAGVVVVGVRVGENERKSPQSPIIAAIEKVSPDSAQPRPSDQDTLRGALEMTFANLVSTDQWRRSIGHIVLPVDRSGTLDQMLQTKGGACWIPRTVGELPIAEEFDQIPTSIIESEAAERFRAAFDALNVGHRILRTDENGGHWRQLVSKISWKSLHDSPQLLEYLTSYRALIEFASSTGHERSIMWAAYPFTLELWETRNNAVLRSVLLSPLHPIRLAWLASVEAGLFASASARNLSGIVDGWNIPHFGPDEEDRRLVSIPLDPGEDQLFLGWSQLVKCAQDGPLESPERAGSYLMPENSTSGINAQVVRDALRDFCRVHSYMPTVAIDLASSTKLTKLSQVDEAVLSSFVGDDAIARVDGIRIFDSLNRIGPAANVERDENSGTRITWKRYDDDEQDATKGANIRILQDSGVAVRVRVRDVFGDGVIGRIPYRRFEVPRPPDGALPGSALTVPGLRLEEEVAPFSNALAMLENCGLDGKMPEVNMRILPTSPLLRESEWTVSGENLITPSALSVMVARTGRMLWEWNPPFLVDERSAARSARVDRRPYFSIARIPDIFKVTIKDRLSLLLNRTCTDDEVDDVLRVLGSKGIGLARLLAIGGSHLHGALGFYLTLKLLEGGTSTGNRFVLPIDACNGFLEVLAGKNKRGSGRRADLLLLDLLGDKIVLTPIEIKFYSLDNPRPALPEPGSGALNEARTQALETAKLLKELEIEWMRLRSDSRFQEDLTLASSALATLVESAMKISPDVVKDREVARRVIRRILSGQVEVRGGTPVIAFYQSCEPQGGVYSHFPSNSDDHDPSIAEFVADPRTVMSGFYEQNEVLSIWRSTIDRASTVNPNELLSEPTPESLGESQEDEIVVDHVEDPAVTNHPNDEAEPMGEGGSLDSLVVSDQVDAVVEDGIDLPDTIDELQAGPKVDQVSSDGVRFNVGILTGAVRESEAVFWPSNTKLNQLNIGIVGDLGTGKTQLSKALVYQLRKESERNQSNPISTLILDYKRDYQDEQFLTSVGGIALQPQNIPLDVFGIRGERTPMAIQRRAMAFADIIQRIFKNLGPKQRSSLGRAVRDLLSNSDRPPTMLQVLDAYRKEAGENDAVVGVLEDFVYGEVFSSNVDDLVPLADILDGRVVTVNLAELGNDQNLKNALVALFLNQYYEYMLKLKKWPVRVTATADLRTLNSYLLVDEATNIMKYKFEVLSQILLQGREFGVGVMLSSQYLSHFDIQDVDYAEPLRSWFIHKVPNVNQRQLAKLGMPNASEEDAQKIARLAIHEAYYVSEGYEGRFIKGTPFYALARSI